MPLVTSTGRRSGCPSAGAAWSAVSMAGARLIQVVTGSPSASSKVAASSRRSNPLRTVNPPVELLELEDEELLELEEDELLVLDELLELDDVEEVPGGGGLLPSRPPRQPRLASQPRMVRVVPVIRIRLRIVLANPEIKCFTGFSRWSLADWFVALFWQLSTIVPVLLSWL